jgi:hypothetical protein
METAVVSDLPDMPPDAAHPALQIPNRNKYQSLAILSSMPQVRQAMSFKDGDTAAQFFSSLRDGSIGLVKVEPNHRLRGEWYQ